MPSLLVSTAAFVALLQVVGLPAAFLLGAMGAAMIFARRGVSPRLPGWLFPFAQAVVVGMEEERQEERKKSGIHLEKG